MISVYKHLYMTSFESSKIENPTEYVRSNLTNFTLRNIATKLSLRIRNEINRGLPTYFNAVLSLLTNLTSIYFLTFCRNLPKLPLAYNLATLFFHALLDFLRLFTVKSMYSFVNAPCLNSITR